MTATNYADFCQLQHGIAPKVKAALLGPNLWAYVKEIGEFIVVSFYFCMLATLLTQLQQDMKVNSRAWKIPSMIFKDTCAFKELKNKVKKILTNFHLEAKKAVSQAASFSSSLTNIFQSYAAHCGEEAHMRCVVLCHPKGLCP